MQEVSASESGFGIIDGRCEIEVAMMTGGKNFTK